MDPSVCVSAYLFCSLLVLVKDSSFLCMILLGFDFHQWLFSWVWLRFSFIALLKHIMYIINIPLLWWTIRMAALYIWPFNNYSGIGFRVSTNVLLHSAKVLKSLPFNPSNAEATFDQSTWTEKNWKPFKPCLVGIHWSTLRWVPICQVFGIILYWPNLPPAA